MRIRQSVWIRVIHAYKCFLCTPLAWVRLNSLYVYLLSLAPLLSVESRASYNLMQIKIS